jgi:3-hydroxybutyryl-CoA dehydrogenase
MSLPPKVGVFGGGRMGAGIAHAFLIGGTDVTVIEVDEANASAARSRVTSSLAKAFNRGSVTQPAESIAERLTVTTDVAAVADCGLVVEAVPEIPDLKADVLHRIEAVAPDAILATNTSSLSIDGLAATVAHPSRLIGLHFFNPVPASALVEIVVGAKTDPEVVANAQDWVAALDKTAITVTDSPGFASSRLGVAIALEAMRMLESGVASAEDIDLAMTLGYKHPMGPLQTTDIVGLDVRLAIAEYLHSEFGDRFAPPEILKRLVAEGNLGRKSGRGFYEW